MFACLLPIASALTDDTIVLNNGIVMPKLAFAANIWAPATCASATSAALEKGFRFVWSSALVGPQCQAAQATAMRNWTGPLFVAGTVDTQACNGQEDCYAQTKKGAEEQFRLLGTGLDMLMLDYPSGSGCDGIRGQWL